MNNISLTDVTLHIDETLNPDQRRHVESDLRAIDGVVSVHYADARPHLMIVEYNPDQTSADSLLASVTGQGFHAEMIGL